jgi:hypothetical protein
MMPMLATVTPLGVVFTLIFASALAAVIAQLAGAFDTPKEQDLEGTSFWVLMDDSRVLGPFPAAEIRSMISAGVLKRDATLLLSEEGPAVSADQYPWLMRERETVAPVQAPPAAPEKPAGNAGGLGKAGWILLLIGGALALADMALAGMPGMLSVGLIGVGIVLAVVGACTTPAKS